MSNDLSPVKPAARFVVLDALRGFALIGICMANFPEFSLYTFQPAEVASAMPLAAADRVTRFLLYLFVDGKFYTLFSLLFGLGFSIILSNAHRRGNSGLPVFYRRMTVLAMIGALHLMFVWSGDILLLYALLGMVLPLFRNASGRVLLMASAFCLLLPVVIDLSVELAGISLSAPVVDAQWRVCADYGITRDNFGYWLRDAESYGQVFQFLLQGALVRVQELVDGNRYFKVLGLFLMGFYIGRSRIYADIAANGRLLRRVAAYGFAIGLPLSCLYALDCMAGYRFGMTVHTVAYTVSVYPLGFAYAAAFCLLYERQPRLALWRWLAAPGRMALTNYIGQSVMGAALFYGIGLGWGAGVGLLDTEVIVVAVLAVQAVFSHVWLGFFRFGPLEWLWRMLTYGKYFALRRSDG